MKSNAIEVTNSKMDILEKMTFLNKRNSRKLLNLIENGKITQNDLTKVLANIHRIDVCIYELAVIDETSLDFLDRLIEKTRLCQIDVDGILGE